MKLKGSVSQHVPGWSGGVLEGAEPDLARRGGFGTLADGLNVVTAPLGRLAVRGGSRVLTTFDEDDVSDVLGVWAFAPCGAIAIAHDDTADTHYAYALTDTLGFALGAPVTETDSRVELGTGWETATAGHPIAVELFETLYIVDASTSSARPLVALRIIGGVLTLVEPTYNLNGGGADSAYPYCAAVYNSALFVAGWFDESDLESPHTIRNSFLGVAPDDAAGFGALGYATLGAEGQRISALEPGRDVLMAAKANELYRIYGTGQAIDGWHYAIQAVENTKGFGAVNPNCLKYVNGYWYGIGQSGPWRSNGSTVEALGVPWRESWQRVNRLETSWVTYQPTPDSRKVWFGFYENGFTDYPEIPFTVWMWDIDRETWSPPSRYPRSFHLVNAILPGSTESPDGSPTTIAQRFNDGAFGFTSVELRWIAGDLEASTEVWTRTGTGAYTQGSTVPAGSQRVRIDVTAGQPTLVKLRHLKNGVAGPYANPVTVYPRLPSPLVSISAPYLQYGTFTAAIYNPIDGADVTVTSSGSASVPWSETFTNLPVGTVLLSDIGADTCVPGIRSAIVQASLEMLTWPVGHTVSRTDELTTAQVCGADNNLSGPTVTQLVESGGMAATSITVRLHPHISAAPTLGQIRVDYKLASASTWTLGTPFYGNASPADHTTLTYLISGLTAGSAYHVRGVMVYYEGTFPAYAISQFDTCYTLLPPPTLSAATAGSGGSPSTNLTITPAVYGTGHNVVVYDERENYTLTQPFATSTPAVVNNTVATAPNTYFARSYHASWPEGFTYSTPVTASIVDPETVFP